MSTPNFPWLPVSALCTETHRYNTHHRTRWGSNTSRALERNGVPGGMQAARLHHTAKAMPQCWVLKNLHISNSSRSKIIAGHVLYEPHTFEKDV